MFTTYGALIGLAVAIVLIVRKVTPAYALVFIDISVITVAPVALAVGRKANIPVPALLLAMIGGGKAGNGVSPNPNTIASSAMIHAGATVLDSLPHGSFFHATGGAVFMPVGERLKLIPYEAAVGLVSTAASVALYLI